MREVEAILVKNDVSQLVVFDVVIDGSSHCWDPMGHGAMRR